MVAEYGPAILTELATVLKWIGSTTAEVNALSAQVAAWKGDTDAKFVIVGTKQDAMKAELDAMNVKLDAIIATLKTLTGPVRIALDLDDATREKQRIPTEKGP